MQTALAVKEGCVLNSALFEFDDDELKFTTDMSKLNYRMVYGLYNILFEDEEALGFALNTPDGIVAFVPGVMKYTEDGQVAVLTFNEHGRRYGYQVYVRL